jgi:hypothetical protein
LGFVARISLAVRAIVWPGDVYPRRPEALRVRELAVAASEVFE